MPVLRLSLASFVVLLVRFQTAMPSMLLVPRSKGLAPRVANYSMPCHRAFTAEICVVAVGSYADVVSLCSTYIFDKEA